MTATYSETELQLLAFMSPGRFLQQCPTGLFRNVRSGCGSVKYSADPPVYILQWLDLRFVISS